MLPDRYVYSIARNISRKSEVVPVEKRDVFSSIEKFSKYEEKGISIYWAKCIVPDSRGLMREGEKIEICAKPVEEDVLSFGLDPNEYEVVFQGILLYDEGVVETFHYVPDVWINSLRSTAMELGVINK